MIEQAGHRWKAEFRIDDVQLVEYFDTFIEAENWIEHMEDDYS